MIPQFYGKIKDGKLSLNRGQVFKAYVQGQKDGDYYVEIHKVKGPPKTQEQLGYYYAVIIPTVYKQLKDDGNDTFVVKVGQRFKEVPLTEEIVDLLLKESWPHGGNKSKAKMSIEEMSDITDWSIRWAAKWLGCVIPPPDKDWRKKGNIT